MGRAHEGRGRAEELRVGKAIHPRRQAVRTETGGDQRPEGKPLSFAGLRTLGVAGPPRVPAGVQILAAGRSTVLELLLAYLVA